MHLCCRHKAQSGWERNAILFFTFCGNGGEGNQISHFMTNLREPVPIIIMLSIVRMTSLEVAAFSD